MLKRNTIAGAALAAALVAGASAASAAVIDFTKATTGTSGSILGGTVTWSLTSNGTLNNTQNFDGNAAPAAPLAFVKDGMGVNDDEISSYPTRTDQFITLTFSAPTLIDAVYFLDLFVRPDGASREIGLVSIDGVPAMQLVATDTDNLNLSGFVGNAFAPILATVLQFTVASTNDQYGRADGALAGVGIAPVPLPAAGFMLAGALGGIAALRRRRKPA